MSNPLHHPHHLLLLLLLLLPPCLPFYDVPSYYGHFSRNYFIPKSIRKGIFRLFEYHFSVDMDYANQTVYFVNSKESCVYKFDRNLMRKYIVAGCCGKIGDRVGGLDVMMFNNPTSLVYFQMNQQSKQDQQNMKMYIVANPSCQLGSYGCQLPDRITQSLTIQNLRLSPLPTQFPPPNSSPQYLYISDTGNHCIKRINLQQKTSMVVAGRCGYKGFLDGPYGFNRLNSPSNLGITKEGVLYFWDSGNKYMRKMGVDGQVFTLLNGACKLFGVSRNIAGYAMKNILCYDNWIEGSTKAPIQHVMDQSEIDICIQQSSRC